MAVGFGTSSTGSWTDVDRSDWSSFYSDAIQDHIIDFFAVDGIAVDPYDGAEFSGSQLDSLIAQLLSTVAAVERHSPEWPFAEQAQIERYFEACRTYVITPHQPRDQVLRTLKECIALAQKAKALDHVLIFCGD